MIIKKCKNCLKDFKVHPCAQDRAKFCCRLCRTKWQKGKLISPNTLFKKGQVAPNKGKSIIHSGTFRPGKLHWNWKGGRGDEISKLRYSREYKLWRKAVYERDKYICIWCGYKGRRLNADHIKPFAYFPELRFAIDNGRTLCEPCHRTTDTFMNRWYSRTLKDHKSVASSSDNP